MGSKLRVSGGKPATRQGQRVFGLWRWMATRIDERDLHVHGRGAEFGEQFTCWYS